MDAKNESILGYCVLASLIVCLIVVCIWKIRMKEIDLRLERLENEISILQSNVDTVDGFLNKKIGMLEEKLAPELIR